MNPIPRSARVTPQQRHILLSLPLVLGIVTPTLIRGAVAVIVGNKSLRIAVANLLHDSQGMLIITAASLVPFVILAFAMAAITTCRTRRACYAFCIAGLTGTFGLLVAGHVAVWHDMYGPGRSSSMAGLALVVIPIYCSATLLPTMLIAHFITKIRWFQAIPAGLCQHCAYNLTGNLSGVCPECGESTSP